MSEDGLPKKITDFILGTKSKYVVLPLKVEAELLEKWKGEAEAKGMKVGDYVKMRISLSEEPKSEPPPTPPPPPTNPVRTVVWDKGRLTPPPPLESKSGP